MRPLQFSERYPCCEFICWLQTLILSPAQDQDESFLLSFAHHLKSFQPKECLDSAVASGSAGNKTHAPLRTWKALALASLPASPVLSPLPRHAPPSQASHACGLFPTHPDTRLACRPWFTPTPAPPILRCLLPGAERSSLTSCLGGHPFSPPYLTPFLFPSL